MEATHEQFLAETMALGRWVAEHYTKPFQVDGRPITCVEMQALLYHHKHDPDLLLDAALARWTAEFLAWDGAMLARA